MRWYNKHMRVSSAAIFLFIFFPSLAFAAGFAKQSLFLSQATVTEGETVFIYATVENDTPSYFSGTLKFSDENGAIGETQVALKSGVANTISVSWTPAAGQHDVTANLVTTDGKTIESEDSIFFVNPKPAPASLSEATSSTATTTGTAAPTAIESSQPIEQWLANTSPGAANLATPLFKAVDAGRFAAAQKLDSGTQWSKNVLAKAAKAPSGWLNTLWLILATLALYTCTVLSYVIGNIGIFYPVFALIFFYILWRLYRLARRR